MTEQVRVEVINSPDGFDGVFECLCKSFGDQINDGIWTVLNPGWNTAEGKESGKARLIEQWSDITTTTDGDPSKVFLKATVPDPSDETRRLLVGTAIWAQWSMVKGYGDIPTATVADLDILYPGNGVEQRFLKQAFGSLVSHRIEAVRQKTGEKPPATFSLDTCVVDPAFQRRGIATHLVQWGLDEAKRRGGLESTTEASAMGRFVYEKLGFKPISEISYQLDEGFRQRSLPPNLFMRTGNTLASSATG